MTVASPDIINQIIFISIGMVILSQLFQKKFGTSPKEQMQMQLELKDLQDRMRQAQNNPQMMATMQQEMMEIMQKTMKNQMLPMLLRSVLFLGILGILRLFYGQYNEIFPFPILFFGKGWFAVYFIVSIICSIIIALVKKIRRSLNPDAQPQEQPVDQIRALKQNSFQQPQRGMAGRDLSQGMMGNQYPPTMMQPSGNPNTARPPSKTKDWKQKLDTTQKESIDYDEEVVDEAPTEKGWKNKL